jgi:serine/threonine protein kinase
MKPTDGLDTTLASTESPTEPKAGDAPRGVLGGYELGAVIGKGGMGEVMLARDPEIGRDVAVKRVRADAGGDAVDRFLREAKIQARLDHPAIVPVYELGKDSEGRPFFTMKRLAGRTLHDVLGAATQQQLLRAFVDVCLAIDFAHSRGVVHRDLKPTNIMLGDYGEVYVLDWGVARVLGDDAGAGGDITTLDGGTQAGAILGTPGYMAPEQVRGESIGTTADSYALGCILFEILAGEPLHPRGHGALAATLASPGESPAARKPDRRIAPELDEACLAALAGDAPVRPTARELADRVQKFLDGDRDVVRRRVLAMQQVERARSLIESGDPARRGDAARAAGRAVALDPDNDAAIELVTKLVLQPPAELPPELAKELAAEELEINKQRSRAAISAYLAVFGWLPFVSWLSIKSYTQLGVVVVSVVAICSLLFYNTRTGKLPLAALMIANLTFVIVFSRLVGNFAITPVLVCATSIALASRPWVAERPWLLVLWSSLAMLLPYFLEAIGVLESTWRMSPEGLLSWSAIIGSHTNADAYTLVVGTVAAVAVVSLFATRLSRDRAEAQRRARVQAWHFAQLLPRRSPSATIGR